MESARTKAAAEQAAQGDLRLAVLVGLICYVAMFVSVTAVRVLTAGLGILVSTLVQLAVAGSFGVVFFVWRLAEYRYFELRNTILTSTSVAIASLDISGNIKHWNSGAERVFGHTAAEAAGKSISILYTPTDVAENRSLESLQFARDRGMSDENNWRQRKDGTRFWSNMVVSAIQDRRGRFSGYSMFARDFTVQKLAEDQLQDQFTLLESIVEGTFEIIALKNSELRYEMINAAGALHYGCSRQDIVGKDDSQLLPEKAANTSIELDRTVLRTGAPLVSEEEHEIRGVRRVYLTHRTPWRDHQGNSQGVISVSTDVTDQRNFEAERKLVDLYRSLFDDAPVPYHEVDSTGLIHRANRKFLRFLGRPPSEVIGSPIWDFILPEERAAAQAGFLRKMNGAARLRPFTRTFVGPHGNLLRAEVLQTRVLDEAGQMVGLRCAVFDLQMLEADAEVEEFGPHGVSDVRQFADNL